MRVIIIFSLFSLLLECQSEILPRISNINDHPHLPRKLNTAKKLGKPFFAAEQTNLFWLDNAKHLVDQQLAKTENRNKAKNVILFLGDGMSHTSYAATRLLLGGEEAKISWEHFPHTASSKTYCVNSQVADSACTGTAFTHGIKTNFGLLGLNAKATRQNCQDNKDTSKFTYSIASWFQKAGRSTGIVTNTRITHATPAAVYAHSTERDWENNEEVRKNFCDHNQIDDIAEQLVYGDVGSKLKVILGGGSKHFIDYTQSLHDTNGARTDGKNLLSEWLSRNSTRKFVHNRAELLATSNDVDQLFGLFHSDHLPYNMEIAANEQLQNTVPMLSTMANKAIDILSKDPNGYYLLIEGGRIDHAHHDSYSKYALEETLEFHKTIQAVVDKVNLTETLIVVTADHAHGFTIGGYSERGTDVYGMADTIGSDGMPYFKISYGNGPSYSIHLNNGTRTNPLSLDTSPGDFRFPSLVPREIDSHSGEDVGIWSTGAWSHLFNGVLEQNMIPHIMAFASCVGDGKKMCDQ